MLVGTYKSICILNISQIVVHIVQFLESNWRWQLKYVPTFQAEVYCQSPLYCISEIPARPTAQTHLHQWWGTIVIIRNDRPPIPLDTYSNSRTTMRVCFKVNKLLLMPNLRRPVNNASSRNYLNACKCIRYDLFAGPSHCLARYMLCNYAVSITVDSTGSIQTIDCTIKHCF